MSLHKKRPNKPAFMDRVKDKASTALAIILAVAWVVAIMPIAVIIGLCCYFECERAIKNQKDKYNT